jgi:hypothetical protein
MDNIYQFPKRQDNRPQPVRSADAEEAPIVGFKADIFLVNGRDVEFVFSYPYCSLPKNMIAAMLRKAAQIVEDSPNRRV